MSATADHHAHLSDEEIDLYLRRQLPEDRVRALEEHYFECRDCLARVEQVEAVIDGLQEPPQVVQVRAVWRAGWLGLAAASTAGLVLGWLLHDSWRPAPPVPTPTSGSLATAAPAAGRANALAEFTLQPLIRNAASGETIRPPAGTSVVLLRVDAGEAGASGSTFEVRLVDKRGQALLTLRAFRSGPDGILSVPIPAAVLVPGQYSLQVRRDATVLEMPFQIEPEP